MCKHVLWWRKVSASVYVDYTQVVLLYQHVCFDSMNYMIHSNLMNLITVSYTHVEQSPTNALYIKY